MEDCLVVTVDVSKNDRPTLLITRSVDALSFNVINQLWDDEAVETYNKLVGNAKECCKTCKHCEKLNSYCCMHPNHAGDYVPPYTVCDDYERK